MLEKMLLVGGPALRPALIAQLLADLCRLRDLLAAAPLAQARRAAHELKGIAATIGAASLAEAAARLDMSLENGSSLAGAIQATALWQQIDDLAALLRAETRHVPPA